jgi:hypothetical protein
MKNSITKLFLLIVPALAIPLLASGCINELMLAVNSWSDPYYYDDDNSYYSEQYYETETIIENNYYSEPKEINVHRPAQRDHRNHGPAPQPVKAGYDRRPSPPKREVNHRRNDRETANIGQHNRKSDQPEAKRPQRYERQKPNSERPNVNRQSARQRNEQPRQSIDRQSRPTPAAATSQERQRSRPSIERKSRPTPAVATTQERQRPNKNENRSDNQENRNRSSGGMKKLFPKI